MGKGKSSSAMERNVLHILIWQWMCVWDCSVTNPGAIQVFELLQELLVGVKPPALRFTVEI